MALSIIDDIYNDNNTMIRLQLLITFRQKSLFKHNLNCFRSETFK